MLRLKIGFSVLAFIVMCSGVAVCQTKDPSTIMENMRQRYAALASYEDAGLVDEVTSGPLPTRNTNIVFKTYFTRPKKIRFEWIENSILGSPGGSLIWSDGTKAFNAYNHKDGKVETDDSFNTTVAGATGVSRGASHTVLDLLSDELSGFSLMKLANLSLKGQEVFDGEECFVIEGHHAAGEPWQLWISKKDSLLRKLKRPSVDNTFVEEIHRNIKVDASVPDALFQPRIVAGRLAEKVAKDKEADIRRLIELVEPREQINQSLLQLVELIKGVVPSAPEKTIVEVIADLQLDSAMVQQLYVPIYDWHYTGEEIKQLIAFYESPLGSKLRQNAKLIEMQAMKRGVGIGMELRKRIEDKLRAKGFKVIAFNGPIPSDSFAYSNQYYMRNHVGQHGRFETFLPIQVTGNKAEK